MAFCAVFAARTMRQCTVSYSGTRGKDEEYVKKYLAIAASRALRHGRLLFAGQRGDHHIEGHLCEALQHAGDGAERVGRVNSAETAFSSISERAPKDALLPTAPTIDPTNTLGAISASRCKCRSVSDSHTATLKPNVIGRACNDSVRPIIGVSRCARKMQQRARDLPQLAPDDPERGAQLQDQAGVDDVLRGHAEMHIFPGVARAGLLQGAHLPLRKYDNKPAPAFRPQASKKAKLPGIPASPLLDSGFRRNDKSGLPWMAAWPSDHPSPPQSGNVRLRVAEFGQQRGRMLAQGRDPTGGRVNLAPAPPRLKLDMAPEIRHFVHLRIGNARPIQPRNDLRRGQL